MTICKFDVSHAEFLMALGLKHLSLPDPDRTPHCAIVLYLALMKRLKQKLGKDRVLSATLIGSIGDRKTDEWIRKTGNHYAKWSGTKAELKEAAKEELNHAA